MRSFSLWLALALVACNGGPRTPRSGAGETHERTAEAEAPARDEPSTPATPAALPVEASRSMSSLTEAESASVCAWLVENAPHRRVECEDGPTFEVGVGHDDGCPPPAAFAGCTLTVGDVTTCMVDNANDPCAHGMFGATSCAAFRECMMLQMGMVREEPPPAE